MDTGPVTLTDRRCLVARLREGGLVPQAHPHASRARLASRLVVSAASLDRSSGPAARRPHTRLRGVLTKRDLDGRAILPSERIDALAHVLELRDQAHERGELPYGRDWPLPPCLECGATVTDYGRASGDGHTHSIWFFPCGHGVVADR